jgi:hypothetical protein
VEEALKAFDRPASEEGCGTKGQGKGAIVEAGKEDVVRAASGICES